ncbi:MAG TPA: ABC transporter permease [Vicinamibacterales bacterium]|jgi:predicted permease|nr:ABC transporter permease [Vicinamibacterales bacterium]
MSRWLDRMQLRLRSLFRRSTVDRDLRRELDAHVQSYVDEQIADGMSADDARRAAVRAFGNVPAIEDACRDTRGVSLVDDLSRDVRYGLRTLRRAPAFTLVAVLTLALGIGANTAIFSVVDAVLLRPLPVARPDRLVLFSDDTSEGTQSSTPPPEGRWNLFSSDVYDALRAAGLPLESVAAFASGENTVTTRPTGEAVPTSRAQAHLVSGNYFEVMGASPMLGRALASSDDRPDAHPALVVSNGYWRDRLDASPNAIGQTLFVNDLAFTVVGVMPASFFGERVRRAPDLWVPLAWQPDIQRRPPARARTSYYWLSLVGRLGPGQTREAAEAAVTTSLRQFLTAHEEAPIDDEARRRIESVRVVMADGSRGISNARTDSTRVLTLLIGAVGLVLLVACANVATLFLARAAAQRSETALRRALGAGRGRLIRQKLTESALVAILGASAGVGLAAWTAPFLLHAIVPPSAPIAATIDGSILGVTLGVTALAILLFGLAPALQAGRVDALAALRSTARGSRRRRRVLGVAEPLVVAQIALSLVLAVGTALLVRSLLALEHQPLGFEQARVLVARLDARLAGYAPADVGTFYRRLYDRVAALPGVESATVARYSPFSGSSSVSTADVEGYQPQPGERMGIEMIHVGPRYPQTLGMPLRGGRALGLDDQAGGPLTAMVNEAFVRRYSPSRSPLGHHVSFGDDRSYEIVGVVGDAQFHDARRTASPMVFTSTLQETGQFALDCELEVRARGDADAMAQTLREAVAAVDSRVVVTRTRTLRAQVLSTFGAERSAAGCIAAFTGLALLLAAVGLYGVVASGVTSRTKEIGVRVALGAARTDVLWLIVRETLVRLAIGLAIGMALAAIASRALTSQLFGVTRVDPWSYATAALVLGLVAVLTSAIPALRAARIDPAKTLRAE